MKNKVLMYNILGLYTIIPILILMSEYLYSIKFYILTGVGITIFIIMKFFKATNKELGITKNNLGEAIKRNIPLIIIGIVIILLLRMFSINRYNSNETLLFYIFYIFISCPIQEFLYRGVFGYFEKEYKSNVWLWLSSFYYSFVHIIYKDLLTCLLTFIIGIIWYFLFRKDKNLGALR